LWRKAGRRKSQTLREPKGVKTLSILREVLDDFVLVSDDEIDETICLLAKKAKLVAEGAGAASLAAALKLRDRLASKKVVGILSGGNIPLERLCDLCRNRRNQRDVIAG
jgi:threonine dehydratase